MTSIKRDNRIHVYLTLSTSLQNNALVSSEFYTQLKSHRKFNLVLSIMSEYEISSLTVPCSMSGSAVSLRFLNFPEFKPIMIKWKKLYTVWSDEYFNFELCKLKLKTMWDWFKWVSISEKSLTLKTVYTISMILYARSNLNRSIDFIFNSEALRLIELTKSSDLVWFP